MESLPPEITRQILNDLPPSSLKAIRLCWRFLEPFILPDLFHTVKVNFAEKYIKRLQGIALSPHLAPLVQQLIWITSGSRDTHDDPHGHINTWAGHEDYIKEFRYHFFLCLDAMSNLHTFASELGPIGIGSERDEIDGLVYALWPAMCRPQSRITSFRCQDPLNYMRWLNYECLQAIAGQHTELPASFPANALRKTVNTWFRETRDVPMETYHGVVLAGLISAQLLTDVDLDPFSARVWEGPLKKLLELDLRIDSAGRHWKGEGIPEGFLRFFLMKASGIRELSLRFRPTRTHSRPFAHSEWVSTAVLACRWKFLQTIKISFVMLPAFDSFIIFMEAHAETLKHILLSDCTSGRGIFLITRFAANSKKIKLHRFLVSPPDKKYPSTQKPRIIPERLILDYINNRDSALDPFEKYIPSRNGNWGTVAQKAGSVSEEWPADNGMHFTCRQCLDLGQVA
ncbi:hypothetical protein CEP54_010336 [Fusarium duplospermum]|uniref:F-box domain-containing protein n=1 Tax=Fusarium duplospermum TaxID=1325734 RepID=A0A428PKM9_9HYPO|nr:hypothetical protein CEP54_010336 [Fusarium duplospermum]